MNLVSSWSIPVDLLLKCAPLLQAAGAMHLHGRPRGRWASGANASY